MNQEIEFRGKGRGSGEWVFGSLIQDVEHDIALIVFPGNRIDVDPETVGQHTGLPDFSKNVIFGGDILDSDRNEFPNDSHCPRVVKFEDGGWRLCYAKWEAETPKPLLNTAEIQLLALVVIGNIHDNPELMEIQNPDSYVCHKCGMDYGEGPERWGDRDESARLRVWPCFACQEENPDVENTVKWTVKPKTAQEITRDVEARR